MLERAIEIVGGTVIHRLINPIDSDFIDDDKENAFVEDILEEEDENNPSDVFSISYMLSQKKKR